MSRRARRRLGGPRGYALAGLLASGLASAAAAAAGEAPAATAERRQELQTEQRELKTRLAQLKKTLAATESAHSEAADALAASEVAISSANRQLQQLAATRRQVERRIAELQESQHELLQAQGAHASRLGRTAREEFRLQRSPTMREWLDPSAWLRERRDGAYLDRVVQERVRRIGELGDRRNQLARLEAESVQRGAELARIDASERAGRAQLLRQQAAHKAVLARLARELAEQRRSVAGLERDDTRLGSLIDQIGRLLAEQARRRAAAGHSAGREAGVPGRDQSSAAVALHPDNFVPPLSTQFARLRGRLLLPVQGTVGSRYGAPRTADDGQPQAGAPPWKGLFILAPAGSPVHAVAAGQVVFADWLRGFGNLMILDHGEGFLSVYADNESLLHGVGDPVQANEVIASVGSSGGSARTGLYFEMRYQGRPFDPLTWAVPR